MNDDTALQEEIARTIANHVKPEGNVFEDRPAGYPFEDDPRKQANFERFYAESVVQSRAPFYLAADAILPIIDRLVAEQRENWAEFGINVPIARAIRGGTSE